MNKKQGLLIVFEGIDGSGKTTQINLLARTLKEKNIDFEVISFPQYGQNEYAQKIFDYLSGKFGTLGKVDPYEMAKLYASDRKTVRDLIKKWLTEGKLVIANRYVSSSKAHLGANLAEEKREEFIKWIDQLEYNENGMPKEDLTILLSVDSKIGQKNSQEKNHPDIHEDNLSHLQKANEIFLELSKKEKNWVVVDCMSNFQMKSPEEIQKEVVAELKII
ncbi:dTMP kinase [Candidatus Daviesbacteria bacterium RIFCSPLOWO2_01_FULL_38_10]|uniref:Thymidylate kinase n=1 Tax=Candidatus Daviesbacteria bacterium GW2011_GWF2_38_6 TaxID=1618432 RepID=A0A0G0KML8_9BACT|nr:MAG: Thymidylate kinase [Candidatus Daviesbacteria bacterium GW2011_GWA2_38_17]KKQ76715.1 MAG: Thymidylate kinase [Candidatus Daviesbacteria bacterium GW2011_GWF2_38_6]OGE26045.1 MAG: dTMP kinase [Candidatus Daviesbacteria bacterium RIFCSPHIGHO2_02_FULL_39_41]OGE37304.1 MAG: dTMP kinase [Candidatus Daviesbacteria bacterium RIFCSPLOWO2_01_FULL_38_10]OGE44859.1 MAG: dTMP kinase [Candidatus Daviesbacteria bacterium RIFCSPHIGHO2_12_FULL_38_25]OGE68064.1 MAG: dTMP kinase [Candidatus Daviesbacter